MTDNETKSLNIESNISNKSFNMARQDVFMIQYSMKVINNSTAFSTFKQELRYSRSVLTFKILGKIGGIQHCKDWIHYVDNVSNDLGPWCSDILWSIFLNDINPGSNEYSANDFVLLQQAQIICRHTFEFFTSDYRNTELFTPKVTQFINCLISLISSKQKLFIVVIVENRITALVLKLLISSLDVLRIGISCDAFLDTFENISEATYSHISRFKANQVNLLITTYELEAIAITESYDYLIRFDFYKDEKMYLASAATRRLSSKTIILINAQNKREMCLAKKVAQLEGRIANVHHFSSSSTDAQMLSCPNKTNVADMQIAKVQMGSYKQSRVKFWENDIIAKMEGSAITNPENEESIVFWLSGFEIEQPEIHTRKIGFCTKKPLPDLPALEFMLDNALHKVHIRNFHTCVHLEHSVSDQLLIYTLQVTNHLKKDSIKCSLDDVPYLLVPLKQYCNDKSHDVDVDWEEIEKTIRYSAKRTVLSLDFPISDTLIYDPEKPNHMFLIQDIPVPVKPMFYLFRDDRVGDQEKFVFTEFYKSRLQHISKMDFSKPLIQVTLVKNDSKKSSCLFPLYSKVWLIPDYCAIYPISASVCRTYELLPEIMTQINAYLLMFQAKEMYNFEKIDDALLREALSCKNADFIKDYERLEYLGDAVLGFIFSTYLYIKYPNYNECQLTNTRSRAVKNSTLAQAGKNIRLYKYIINQKTNRDAWQPPAFVSCYKKRKSVGFPYQTTRRSLSDSTIADVMEAILGAAFLSHCLDGALHTATNLLLPFDGLTTWSDMSEMCSKMTYGEKSSYNIDLDEFYQKIGYTFNNPILAEKALTQRNCKVSLQYERLEFLGDAVLGFFAAQYLYKKYPTALPGELTNLRSMYVSNATLAFICIKMDLQKHIRHSSPKMAVNIAYYENQLRENATKEKNDNDFWLSLDPPKVLADVVESVIGAIFIDANCNPQPAYAFFETWLIPLVDGHIPGIAFQSAIWGFRCHEWKLRQSQPLQHPNTCLSIVYGQAFAQGLGRTKKSAKESMEVSAIQNIQQESEAFRSLCTCRKSPSHLKIES
ncbi:ribonuclease III [Rhizopus microsporus ATCC 52813]|uniref:Ribonuclease III n=1 Tax=Rhizopus microsporus ATCC 52813 TaxID=1340429 RepID=A0A2G4SLM6_RHIZD|nr:ribonuclease III [Rhizopus microsporus ATCC 52813]PHZ09670.1 ribonuclease III [Rhizopus microsporus ATCC 52813]